MMYVTFTIVMAVLALVNNRWRKLKTVLFVGIVVAAPILYFDTLSKPKLLTDEWRNDERVRVVGYAWKEGVAVYYWLDLPGIQEPRYYYEPWSDEARKRVEEMQRGAEGNQEMEFKFPFERSWGKDKPKTIHPIPQPNLPEKQPPEDTTPEFQARAYEIPGRRRSSNQRGNLNAPPAGGAHFLVLRYVATGSIPQHLKLHSSLRRRSTMPTKEQQDALLRECEKYGVDVNDVKHFWHKSKSISMFVVAQNRPTYEKVRDGIIKEMKKYAPKYPAIKRKFIKDKHLLVIDPADIHIGKLSLKDETGYHYDIKTAIKYAEEGVSGIVEKSSGFPIERIMLIVGNDVLHTDNPFRATTAGTKQDTDSMWWDAFTTARQMYVRILEELRAIAPVDVVFNPSNHDYSSGYMLVDALSCWFHTTKDVTFDANIAHRKYYKYGESMIATTHGDGAKNADMPLLMAQEAKEMWAETTYRYVYQHHLHHRTKVSWQSVKDHPGITLTILRSPSAPDGWHDRNGFTGSPMAIEGFIHSKEYGQTARLTHYLK